MATWPPGTEGPASAVDEGGGGELEHAATSTASDKAARGRGDEELVISWRL